MSHNRLSKITSHPNKEEIIQKLTEGESVRNISKWLEEKYNKNVRLRHLRISVPTLQAFRKEVLKLDGQALADLQEAKQKQESEIEAQFIKQTVTSSSAYKDKLNQIADKHLDVATRIVGLSAIIDDRIEHYFNLIKSGETTDKADYEMRKYIDQMMVLMRDWKKLVEGLADKRVDYNVNITVMNEQIQGMQSVIVDLIREEMGAEKAMDFMDKLSNRLGSGQEVKALPGKVVDVKHETE